MPGLLAITVPKDYGGADVRAGTLARSDRHSRARRRFDRPDPAKPLLHAGGAAPAGHGRAEALLLRPHSGRRADRQRTVGNRHQDRARSRDAHHARRRRSIVSTATNSIRPACCSPIGSRSSPMTTDNVAPSLSCRTKRSGITIVDDWTGFGQRVTGSGTTLLDNVEVHPFVRLVIRARCSSSQPRWGRSPRSCTLPSRRASPAAALADADPLRSHVARARGRTLASTMPTEDPYTIAQFGEMKIRVSRVRRPARPGRASSSTAAAEPDGRDGRRGLRRCRRGQGRFDRGGAFVSQQTDRACRLARDPAEFGLDRHWRNARTHTCTIPFAGNIARSATIG